jgi:hypothetical protein
VLDLRATGTRGNRYPRDSGVDTERRTDDHRSARRTTRRFAPRLLDRTMSSGFEAAKQNVVETLEEIDESDDFIFVSSRTDGDSGGELSIQSHVGSSEYNTPYANLVGMQILLMHRHFEDYPLDRVAQDCLSAARAMARDGEIEER